MIGCGDSIPFDIVPVKGKVTYEDGSIIKAARILVTFNPIDAKVVKKKTAPGGRVTIDLKDGTFSEVTSRKYNDGLLIGRHKVVVVAFEIGPGGPSVPSNVVPAIYRKLATTPLEVEVEASNNNNIHIRVKKPS